MQKPIEIALIPFLRVHFLSVGGVQVGIEDVEDLIADLEEALSTAPVKSEQVFRAPAHV